MKKVYTLTGVAVLAAGMAMAQVAMPEQDLKPVHQNESPQALPGNALIEAPAAIGDTIWSEDFAAGLPGTWSKVDNTGSGYDWVYSTAANLTCTYTNFTFASTSVSNGFMMLFGDKYNADAACTILAGSALMDAYIQTPAINLSAYTTVLLKFQHGFRYCCNSGSSKISVFASNDGTNWTEFNVKGGLNANVASLNPKFETVNISSVASGQSTVYIRFHKYAASHYYWAVDDIALVEGASDDMAITEELADFNYDDGGFYTRMPSHQGQTTNITWRSRVFNNGSNAQTNVTLGVDVKKGGTSVYTQSSTPKTVNSFSADTLAITTPWVPADDVSGCAEIGNYSFNFAVTQTETDQDPANSVKAVNFALTDTVFARDYGVSGANVAPDSYTCCQSDGSEVGTMFEFTSGATATSISFFCLSSSDSAGISVFANLYRLNFNGGTINVAGPVGQSDIYDITTKDLGKWVTIPFTAPTAVEKDSTFIAAIAVFGYDPPVNADINMGGDIVVNNPPVTSFIYGSTGWGWITSQPMIRLNVQSICVGIEEIETAHNLKVFPNPNSGVFTVTADNLAGKTTTIEVTNIVGQVVYSRDVKTGGALTEVVDISGMDRGMYFIRLLNNDRESVHKVVVE